MKFKQITLIISAIVLLGFTACQELDNPVDTETKENIIVFNDAIEIDGDLATSLVFECSFESDAYVPGDHLIFENCRFDRKDKHKKHKNCNECEKKEHKMVGKVLPKLKLTEDQVTLLKVYIHDHRDCIEFTMQTWRDAVAPIIEKANAEKTLIKTALKNEEMTRLEAYTRLDALNKKMREEIAALGLREEIKASIEDCNKVFLENIKALLVEKQYMIWIAYFPE